MEVKTFVFVNKKQNLQSFGKKGSRQEKMFMGSLFIVVACFLIHFTECNAEEDQLRIG